MSSPAERLGVIYDSYQRAYGRRAQDLKEADSEQQAQAVLDNIDSLEGSYLTAGKDLLDATGGAVEAAYQAATAARDQVEKAYQDAKALAQKITAVAHCASSVASLVEKAQ